MKRLFLLAALGLCTVPTLAQVQTQAIAQTFAAAGAATDADTDNDGPNAGPSLANIGSIGFMAGGQATVNSEVRANYGVLRALGSIELDNQGVFTKGIVGALTGDDVGLGATFSDSILIGGPGRVHTFRVHYRLEGAGTHAGPGAMADLFHRVKLQVGGFGTGITLLNAPQFTLMHEGTGIGTFLMSDYMEFSAPTGATLNLSGGLGAGLQMTRAAADLGLSTSILDVSHTGLFTLEALTPGTTFAPASGANYLGSSAPEPATLALALVALPLLCRRRKA